MKFKIKSKMNNTLNDTDNDRRNWFDNVDNYLMKNDMI